MTWLRLRLAQVTGDDQQQALAAAQSALRAAADIDPPPALHILAQQFQLSRFEQEVLLLCAGMEFDTRIAALCARAQDDPQRPYPTFALALALFDDPAWDIISPERPLRFWRLIEINQPAAQPLTNSSLRADERIVNFIKGLNYLDDRLIPYLVSFDVPHSPPLLPPSQEKAVNLAVGYLQNRSLNGTPPIVQLLGSDSLSKQLVAQKAATTLDQHIYRLPAGLLPEDVTRLETIARLWQRESILLPIALYLDAQEMSTDQPAVDQISPLQRFVTQSQGFFFLGAREIQAGLGATAAVVEVQKPTPGEQQRIWCEVLGEVLPDSPSRLASQFNLNAVTIRQVATQTLHEAAQAAGTPTHQAIWDVCLVNTRPRLDLLAQRIEPKATWADIVLTDEITGVLQQIAAQIRHRHTVYDEWGFRAKMSRGLGISALFAGESGTGKTMAAEVLANELRLNLYRIDLSAVVSKYIGETEKNLRRLFDAAEDGGAILFFDEADALFGKRSEVKDSHDRYANIEVNYLLQRMESYSGLAILATNMRSALDQAFTRRLRFIINFAFPNREQRKAIWQRIFPAEARLPAEGLDYEHLARLNLTGGNIQNVAMSAAFMAAENNGPVTMPMLMNAARTEFRKMERPIREAELRWPVTKSGKT